jgi:signal transduction histidine kinase
MRISEFIGRNAEEIIREWEDFARTCPPAPDLDYRELRNNISGLLKFIIDDLEMPQMAVKQSGEPGGRGPQFCGDNAAAQHAEQRFSKGFDTLEMISEFRALRASIIRLWRRQLPAISAAELDDLVRFNESVDQLLSDSISRYMEKEKRARTLFSGTLVHDLRNPLNAIVQATQLLQLLGGMPERQAQLVSQIQRSAHRIGDLVSQLIDAVRIRLGKPLPISRRPMDMQDVARQVVEELQLGYPDHKISLQADRVIGQWDHVRVSQIISNLVGNALQHGKPGGEITVSVRQEPEEAILSVHNEGVPIPPDVLPTIFDPLTRGLGKLPEGADNMSMGLGLFISRQIALAHGGSISVVSTAEEGTTFTARLPRFYQQSAVDWEGPSS